MKNKSFIHQGMKNAKSEVDFEDRATVQRILKRNFNIPALMDEVIFINKSTGYIEEIEQRKFSSKEEIFKKYWIHNPDLKIKVFNFPCVVEIDGDVHWQSNKGIKQTNDRNYHYELAGIKMLWLTRKEVRNDSEIQQVINAKVAGLLGLIPLAV